MTAGWIYAFADSGYERGVKIGRDGATKGMRRFEQAWCYSPRPMEYVASWQIPASLRLAEAERRARHDLPALATRHGGSEWLALTRAEAIEAISSNLGAAPSRDAITLRRVPEYDDFRNPKRISAATRYKQVLWVYQEEATGRVKTQRIDDWGTPREKRRTYSRNGFVPIAAFTYAGPVCLRQNLEIHDAWEQAVQTFGKGAPCCHGWLPEGTLALEVADLYRRMGLIGLDDLDRMPIGVRQKYNRRES